MTARMLVVQDDGERARPPLPQQPAPPPAPISNGNRHNEEREAPRLRGQPDYEPEIRPRKKARRSEQNEHGPRRTVTMTYDGATAGTDGVVA